MKLYGYFRSSAAFRVRVALNLKKLSYETVAINLPKGDQFAAGYKTVNPQARVPTLVVGDDVLFQSMAIIEYLDEKYAAPPFLPKDTASRARVRGLANIIACDTHPLNNLAVLKYLKSELGVAKEAEARWYCHWIALGFQAFEANLIASKATGRFCHGDRPGLADICLVPQVFNARRYSCDLAPYPTLMRVFENCMKHEAFDRAQPDKQPDAGQAG